jgi:hypothetical protein
MSIEVTAYCWANGVIEIGPTLPNGALPIVKGKQTALEEAIHGLATKSHAPGEWLIPKNEAWLDALVRKDHEAAENAAFDSMMDFRARLVRVIEVKQ